MRDHQKGKSYSQVMNEWNAQRSFLKRAGSSLLRPPMSSRGGSLLWGWLWRLLFLVLIPALAYMGWIRIHAKSGVFTTQMGGEIKKYLGTNDIKLWRSRWDWNGELRIERMAAKGGPANFFTSIEASQLNTWVKVPAVFKKDWHLAKVDAASAKVKLRNGLGTVAAATPGEPALLTAGWGISPDFSTLKVDTFTCRELELAWGSSPATSGLLSDTRLRMQRGASGGWQMACEGGTATIGWLAGMKITALDLDLAPAEVRITKGEFMLAGGGTASLTGGFSIAESPEIKAVLTLTNAAVHDFFPSYAQAMLSAVCDGRVDITGSTNRSSGIMLDAQLIIQSGSVKSLPILNALEIVTGEARISTPSLAGGKLHLISRGSDQSGGLIIEGKDILLDCGTHMKMGITFHHERKAVLATNITEAAAARPAESSSVATTAKLRIGLAPELAAKLNTAIRSAFGAREEQGYHWIEIPYDQAEAQPTRAAADRILQLHQGS